MRVAILFSLFGMFLTACEEIEEREQGEEECWEEHDDLRDREEWSEEERVEEEAGADEACLELSAHCLSLGLSDVTCVDVLDECLSVNSRVEL